MRKRKAARMVSAAVRERARASDIRGRVSGRGGFTLAEMMAAMLIMLIASGLIAQTMAFAVQQTRKQYDTDDAQQAYTELVTAIRADLEYATGEFDFNIENYTKDKNGKYMYDDLNFEIEINGENASDATTPDDNNGSVIVEVSITKNRAELLNRTFTVIPADANLKINLTNMNTTGD